jgi:hypothetical protein
MRASPYELLTHADYDKKKGGHASNSAMQRSPRVADLMSEVAQFQDWAAAYPPERRGGEWECDYDQWPNLYDAVLEFVDARPFSSWSAEERGRCSTQ